MSKLFYFALAITAVASSATAPSIPEISLTPAEVDSGDKGDSQIGRSKLAGVDTKVLSANPAAAGFYSILLFVPAVLQEVADNTPHPRQVKPAF